MAELTDAAPTRLERIRVGGATWRFILRRALYLIVVVLAVYTLAFFLLYALPGDPAAIMLERRSQGAGSVSPQALQALNERYGFDQPLLIRYFATLGQFLSGDFGISFQSGKPALALVAEVAPNTLILAAAALALAVPGALLLALTAVWSPDGLLSRILTSTPALVASIPAFWLGLILLQVFSFQLRWFPSSGGSSIASLVLPAIALALPVSAPLSAVLIRSLADTSRQGWVRLLRSRGLPWRQIYVRHIARNGLLPFVTLLGVTVAGVMIGTVVTETVFSRSGLGRLLVSSVETQDAPVVLLVATFAALIFALVNFAVDLLYPVLDPRLRKNVDGVLA